MLVHERGTVVRPQTGTCLILLPLNTNVAVLTATLKGGGGEGNGISRIRSNNNRKGISGNSCSQSVCGLLLKPKISVHPESLKGTV